MLATALLLLLGALVFVSLTLALFGQRVLRPIYALVIGWAAVLLIGLGFLVGWW